MNFDNSKKLKIIFFLENVCQNLWNIFLILLLLSFIHDTISQWKNEELQIYINEYLSLSIASNKNNKYSINNVKIWIWTNNSYHKKKNVLKTGKFGKIGFF